MSPLQEIFHLKSTEGRLSPAELQKEAELLFEEYLNVLLKSPLFLQALGKSWQDSQWSLSFGTTIRQPIRVENENFHYIIKLHQDNSKRTLNVAKETVNEGKATSREAVEIELCPALKKGTWKEETTKIVYLNFLPFPDAKCPSSMNTHTTIDQAKEFLQRMKTELQSS